MFSSTRSPFAVGRAFQALWLCLFLTGAASLGLARQQSAQLRTVRGTVVDGSGAPVSGAVVYLKNTKTLEVRTYFSSRNGDFRFSGLDPNVDYQIHAEYHSSTSAARTISSFDSNPDIIIQLKLDRKKSSH